MFIRADLAHRRKLEGQICADTVSYHIAEDCQWRQDQKNVRAACTSSWPDGPSPPLTFARSRCEREQASPGNLDDVWPSHMGPGLSLHLYPTPSDWFPRPLLSCTTPLDTSAGIWCTQHSSMSRGATITIIFGLMLHSITFLALQTSDGWNQWLNVHAPYRWDFVQKLKKNQSYKQLIRDTH